ncbi:hypothetical protein GCM10009665_55210 [Kitasatospora nipponensis]|uniref:Uncharacterized protein n=1 Tax=Kitasatospora nipponensis TaxID=258049 RepID=A0ABN1WP28_9ACTN
MPALPHVRLRGAFRGLGSAGGWSLWVNGAIPSGTRFWVAVNDQPAHPWN